MENINCNIGGLCLNLDATLRLVFSLPNHNDSSHLHSNQPLSLSGADEAFLVLGRQYSNYEDTNRQEVIRIDS